MASRKDLKDHEILRFQRFMVTESAPATFTQQSFDTQLSIDRGLLWLIHFIEFAGILPSSIDDPAASASEYISAQITRESKDSLVSLDNADCIAKITLQKERSAAIGTDAGPMVFMGIEPIHLNYYPALAYAAQNIYVSIVSTSAAAQVVRGRIGYTLRKVTDKFFYRVAQALIS